MEKYSCRQCHTLFVIPSRADSETGRLPQCPKCGSDDIEVLPAWVPIGYDPCLYYSPSTWQYSCPQCKATFELPVPSGPTEEQQRKCPTCGSGDIKRLTELVTALPMYCS
jgi:DNA-directed RNA polymerase subunit RPC12/RpoP